jgi:ferredoxin-type protein NapG
MEASRRDLFVKGAQIGAYTLVGGVIWAALLHESRANAFAPRPPGALAEAELLAACIKCGICVDACPFDTLVLARSGGEGALGVPRFVAREVPCFMCPDVPCARACPTGALRRDIKIEQARMGLAVLLDRETCLAVQGLRCEVCYRVCPLLDKAITLHSRPGTHGGPHAFFEPVVNSGACTGCGMCEHACVLEEAAIKVLPVETAKGGAAPIARRAVRERARPGAPQRFDPRVGPGRKEERWEERALEKALQTLEGDRKLYD